MGSGGGKVCGDPKCGGGGDAADGKGLRRRLGRRLEGVAEAVGGGYCRLQMPLRPAVGVGGTVAPFRGPERVLSGRTCAQEAAGAQTQEEGLARQRPTRPEAPVRHKECDAERPVDRPPTHKPPVDRSGPSLTTDERRPPDAAVDDAPSARTTGHHVTPSPPSAPHGLAGPPHGDVWCAGKGPQRTRAARMRVPLLMHDYLKWGCKPLTVVIRAYSTHAVTDRQRNNGGHFQILLKDSSDGGGSGRASTRQHRPMMSPPPPLSLA